MGSDYEPGFGGNLRPWEWAEFYFFPLFFFYYCNGGLGCSRLLAPSFNSVSRRPARRLLTPFFHAAFVWRRSWQLQDGDNAVDNDEVESFFFLTIFLASTLDDNNQVFFYFLLCSFAYFCFAVASRLRCCLRVSQARPAVWRWCGGDAATIRSTLVVFGTCPDRLFFFFFFRKKILRLVCSTSFFLFLAFAGDRGD